MGLEGAHRVVSLDLLQPCATRSSQPISVGVPLSRGDCRTVPTDGQLASPCGKLFPVQFRPLSRWFDGSVSWLLADTILSGVNASAGPWQLLIPREPSSDATRTTVSITSSDSLVFPPCGGSDVRDFVLRHAQWSFIDKRRQSREVILKRPKAVVDGTIRATMRQAGEIAGLRGLRIAVEWDFYPLASLARCNVTLHNSRRARHRGGLWDLGDAGSHLFHEFSFRLELPSQVKSMQLRPETQSEEISSTRGLKLYQDSSGGEHWRSQNHVNRHGIVPCQFRGYQLKADDQEQAGLRATPTIAAETADWRITAAVPDFWQQFPKSLEANESEIRIGLFPSEWSDTHELQGGERKTHSFWLCVQSSDAPNAELDWVYAPARFLPTAAACDDENELWGLGIGAGVAADSFEQVTGEAIDGPGSVIADRERVDEYGWRNYGDFFAGHEQLHYGGKQPLISHYNNQFDVLRGLLRQTLQTRDVRWYELADALARHVMDIDIYHTDSDRAAYSGGMFWFTDHYLHAETSSHRTYSQRNASTAGKPYGGGPGAEHNYTSGLKLYYFLTGSVSARKAVIGLADWVVRMEDGRRNIFGLVDDGQTGMATVGYAKPSRGGANSINALLDAWELTGKPEYRYLCEEIISRCIHPDADVATLDLMDLEASWSYTMFYSSVAKYLFCKEAAGECDVMYAYARRCLLRLGEWMLSCERPYFDQVEKMEFPTETWAAQELRKANVLRYAARYADEVTGASMRERASELGDRAWSDLLRFETRTVSRSLAIVLNDGMLDCSFRRHSLPPAPKCDDFSFSAKEIFETQRQRVWQQLKSPRGIVVAALRLLSPGRWREFWRRPDAADLEARGIA